VGVTRRGAYFEDAVAYIENGDVEGTAAQVVDQDGFVLLLIQSVGKACRGWFVDNAQYFKTGDFTGVLGCCALCVVKVRRDGDDCLIDGLAEVCFGVGLKLLQNHR